MLVFAVLCALAVAIESASVGHPETYTSRAKRCACEVPHDDDHDDMHQENAERLDEMDLTLNRLIAKAQHLADEFEHMVHEREEAATKADSLKLRIAKKDEVCPKGQFRCLSSGIQCVADLLVCDGHKDCDDGSDEDEHVCKNPFEIGMRLEATMVYDRCQGNARLKTTSAYSDVTDITENKHFNSIAYVQMMFYVNLRLADMESAIGMPFTMHYHFGKQRVYGSARIDHDNPNFVCDMVNNDEVFMVCLEFMATRKEACAKYIYVKSEQKGRPDSKYEPLSGEYIMDVWTGLTQS